MRMPSWSTGWVFEAMKAWMLLLLILPVCAAPGAGVAASQPAPNIVFILTDDLGIHDLGCYGRVEHHTPHLDRLAAQGARFTSAYCAQPICSPSRAALMTGKHPARLHLTTYLPGRPDCPAQKLLHPAIRQQLPLEERTLAEYLRAAGYATACIGKWHLGGAGFGPQEQGFEFLHVGRANTTPSDTEGGKGEFDLTAAAERFIEANQQRPFFLFLSHNSPHIPYKAQARRVEGNQGALEPVYAAVIETLDAVVGRILDRLDALHLTDRTLVVFTSDNGGLHVPEGLHQRITHNGPFRAGKGFLYEGGLRIPLLVRWPGRVEAGRVVDAPVVNTDWLPTLLEAAGLPVPADLDGRSMTDLLTRGRGDGERTFYWHFPHYNNQGGRPSGAVRSGNWKLIEFYDHDRVELFELERDPGETRNLAEEHPERVRQLLSLLRDWRKAAAVQTNSPNPAFDPEQYRRLYADFDVSRYNAADADEEVDRRAQAWRRDMNEAVQLSRPPAAPPGVRP